MALITAFILVFSAVAGMAQDMGSSYECTTGIHMIVARGTGEMPGMGRMGVVADNVSSSILGSMTTALHYPAAILEYNISVAIGADVLTEQIAAISTTCPQTKIALLGYSQVRPIIPSNTRKAMKSQWWIAYSNVL